jgi:hypothetical protein
MSTVFIVRVSSVNKCLCPNNAAGAQVRIMLDSRHFGLDPWVLSSVLESVEMVAWIDLEPNVFRDVSEQYVRAVAHVAGVDYEWITVYMLVENETQIAFPTDSADTERRSHRVVVGEEDRGSQAARSEGRSSQEEKRSVEDAMKGHDRRAAFILGEHVGRRSRRSGVAVRSLRRNGTEDEDVENVDLSHSLMVSSPAISRTAFGFAVMASRLRGQGSVRSACSLLASAERRGAPASERIHTVLCRALFSVGAGIGRWSLSQLLPPRHAPRLQKEQLGVASNLRSVSVFRRCSSRCACGRGTAFKSRTAPHSTPSTPNSTAGASSRRSPQPPRPQSTSATALSQTQT